MHRQLPLAFFYWERGGKLEIFTSFSELIKEYADMFDSLIKVEEQKIDAINKNQVTFVEDCMNQEQAAILKLRGLELQRAEVMKELGCEGLTFRQVIEKYPEHSALLLPLFQQLSDRLQTFRSLNDNAKDLIEVNLHVINSLLNEKEEQAQSYAPNGNDENKTKHFTSRSV